MIKGLFTKKDRNNINIDSIDFLEVPKHVAIIMDGNGRWAKGKGLPRNVGHRKGINTIIEITRVANSLGINVLTLYAFSTENWKRPKKEVNYLMGLPNMFLNNYLDELIEKNVQVKLLGFDDLIPDTTLETVKEAVDKTKNNTGLILNFALNYGGRAEIIAAIRNISQDVLEGKTDIENISEEHFERYLLTKDYSNPDLLIRTGGELRISNFLLWQLAYSELFFTSTYWPDFDKNMFYEAIIDYQQRKRRYGGI